jgi:hypothetical protein
MRSEPPKSGKSGALFYHPAQNVNLVLFKLNGTAISRNEHRIIGTIKSIRKKNEKKKQEIFGAMTEGHI